MAKETSVYKALAGTFVIFTVAAIVSLITMTIFYQIEISRTNVTSPPTFLPTTPGPPPVMRLPKNLIPTEYEVNLKPYFHHKIIEGENVTRVNQTTLFTGTSTVYFLCVQSTRTIFLHSLDLNITGEAAVKHVKSQNVLQVLQMIPHLDHSNFLEIQLDGTLEEGQNYSLFLSFMGNMSPSLRGMYMSSYQEDLTEEGQVITRYVVATNLEPTDARRVFPCFDEPEMKARFKVKITHRDGTTALANEKDEEMVDLLDEWWITSFKWSPVMSTYLFAFVVSDFKWTSSKLGHLEIHTYARPEAVAAGHTRYASSITRDILSFFQKYTGIPYQLEKLDQIALPDLGPAAMENWGLITYQERALLQEEGVSSLMQKQSVASLIAHEMAHQWFGNLVTMKWWNQIWLNEGFATYMSYMAVEQVAPELKMTELYFMMCLHQVFELDSLASSRALNPPAEEIRTADEIEGLFDSIAYSKGALVVRMMVDCLGESIFHKGIKEYLRNFKLKNVDQNDFWETMQKVMNENASGVNLAEMMNTWTDQIGYPVITIDTKSGHFSQQHFLFNDSTESSLVWHVPIRVKSETSDSRIIGLNTSKAFNSKLRSENGEWILANINCTGYFRVNYDPENWERLLTQMETNPQRIPLMNRGQLIDDAFNLARAKQVDVTLALNSTRFLRNETEYIPWESADRNLVYFFLMFDRTEVYGPMQAYLRQQIKGLYGFLSNYTNNSEVPDEPSLQASQILAVRMACSSGLPECVEMASQMFHLWMNNDTNRIHPNLRSVIYCQAVAAGGRKEWEFAWEKFQNASSGDIAEKMQLLKGLSCTTRTWLLSRYLDYTLDPKKIRLMEVATAINYVAENVAGHALAWNFIRAHWDYVAQEETAALIHSVSSRFSSQFELAELGRFAANYDLGSATRAVNQAMEQTRVNIQWVKEFKDVVLKWFESEDPS